MTPDQRADAARPAAHALVAAVARYDRAGVAEALLGADLTALAVVLADLVARPSESAWLRALLADLRNPDLTAQTLAWRYGMTQPQLERLVHDNGLRRHDNELDLEATGGRWVTVRGVQRWVSEGVVA